MIDKDWKNTKVYKKCNWSDCKVGDILLVDGVEYIINWKKGKHAVIGPEDVYELSEEEWRKLTDQE